MRHAFPRVGHRVALTKPFRLDRSSVFRLFNTPAQVSSHLVGAKLNPVARPSANLAE